MNWKSLLFVLVAALVLVAGCAAPKGPASAPAPVAPPGPTPEQQAAEQAAMMDAKGGVSIVSVPSEVLIGKPIEVKWHVSGKGETAHTAIHYGTKSKADVTDPTTTTYPSAAPKGYASGPLPGDFSASIAFDEPIKIYLRAHAIVDGKNYWTDEQVVSIVTKISGGATSTMPEGSDAGDDAAASSY